MKKTSIIRLLALALTGIMLVSLPAVTASAAGASEVVSGLSDLYAPYQLDNGTVAFHGGGQTRMVSVSHGAYYAVNAYNMELSDGDKSQVSLIRMTEDGANELIYQDYIRDYASGPTVLVMADNDENIWMYAGWECDNGYHTFAFNLWRYDYRTGSVDQFTSFQEELFITGGYGYSTAIMDADNRRIMANTAGADKPGYLMWSIFDMDTLTWAPAVGAVLEYRNAYTFGYPDGNGGFWIINQRDVKSVSVMSDQGISVEKAENKYNSRDTDNNMLFDKWVLGHIADPAVGYIEERSVEDPEYKALEGLYPEFTTVFADPMLDSKGYLHFCYVGEDQGHAGCRYTYVVYDMNNDMKEVARTTEIHFLMGKNGYTFVRLFEDTHGNVYVVGLPCELEGTYLEVWLVGEDYKSFKLVWWHDFGVGDGGSLIVGNSRGNSSTTDLAYFGLGIDGWNGFTVDFAKIRAIRGIE